MNRMTPLITINIPLAWPVRLLAIIVVSAALISFGTGGTPIANAQSPQSVIEGIVVNGTEGGVLPADLEVLLLTVDDAAGQIIEQIPTKVAADGTFSFGNLISSPGITFRVVANAGDYTPSVDLTSLDDWSNVRLTIYDQTISLEDISVSTYVLMIPTIDARSRLAGILAVINVVNNGDRVWVPDLEDPDLTRLDLLRFNLPEGFSDLFVESELPAGNILEISTGFAMTNPIPPGDFSILMQYIVEYEADGFDFTLKLPYGADQIRMLLPDGGGTISGEGFGPIESVVVNEAVFNSVEGTDYPAGEEINISFSGMPQPTPFQTLLDFLQGRTYVIVIIWVVGIALLGILGYALYSSRKKTAGSRDGEEEFASRADIVVEIASLDEEFEKGDLDEDDYNDRRDDLKRLALEFEDANPVESQEQIGQAEEPEK